MGRNVSDRKCDISGCDRKHRAHGMCQLHYLKNKRFQLMDILGGRVCVKCGFNDIRALQIEHRNGGGNKEYKEIGSWSVYIYYINNPKEANNILQVYCANCNWIKKHELNENRK